MRVTSIKGLLTSTLFSTLIFLQTFAIAEEFEFASKAEIDVLKGRITELESRLAATDPVIYSQQYSTITDAGITGGAELVYLKPYQSEGESPGYDFKTGSRFWVGWTSESGLGFRARWFDIAQRNGRNILLGEIQKINMQMIDLEVTDKFHLNNTEGLFSAGIRFADYKEFGLGDFDMMNNSVGPVLGVQLNRQATENIDFFVIARGSLQFASHGLDNGRPMTNMLFNIIEVQMGVEWTCPQENGGEWFLRTALETQYWSGGVIGDGDTEDIGLIGGTIAAGFSR